MGGTRCVFRDCQVSTHRNPKMHFFKLPIRDPVRLKAWLKNCGNAEILNVPREKLTNRAVCARHFRYECFMNYKLDRLVPNQVPTLIRVSKESAWDLANLDENGEPSMVKLTPTLIHLIPPSDFECPLGFSADDRFARKYARRRTSPKPLSLEEVGSKKQRLQEEERISPVIDLTHIGEQELMVEKKKKLEQLDIRGPIKCIPESKDSTVAAVDLVQPAALEQKRPNKFIDRRMDTNGWSKQIEEKKAQLQEMEQTRAELKQQRKGSTVPEVDTVTPDSPSSENRDKLIDLTNSQESLSESKESLDTTEDPVEPDPTVNKNLDELQLKYDELKKDLERISLENASLKQEVDQLETKLVQANKAQRLTASCATPAPPLSKPQLYRGIQKYLGPTMAALVRMEMFGGGERAWKEDERDFAKELLQLGEHVYTHCCEEWRFRLPSLRQAKTWLDEREIAQDEEEDL